MYKYFLLFLFATLVPLGLLGQETRLNSGVGLGFQVGQYQNDFGIGLQLISPYLANDRIGLRLKANVFYHQGVIDGTSEWVPYGNLSLGLIGVGGYVHQKIRLYGEGGLLLIFPSDKLSSVDLLIGGYGHFGFEFFFSNSGNYFIELGSVGTGARADRLATTPIYSNGMAINVGLRFFL